MTRSWQAGLMTLAAVLLPVSTAWAEQPSKPAVPKVVKAAPALEWNARFAGKEGWIGGDGVYSAALGPKRVLWFFGDTLLGTVKDGKRAGAKMVNNTVAVQDGIGKDAALRFISGKGSQDKPAALFTPNDGKGWFWVQAAAGAGERLFVFLPQLAKTKDPGVFGFKQIGQWLATVENPGDDPRQWRVKQQRLPFAEFGAERDLSFGSAVMADGEFLYVYGYDEERGKGAHKRRLTVARVPAGKLDDFKAWRFRTADSWSEKPADAAPQFEGLATEFSVSRAPTGKGYVAVYTENGLSDRIVGRFADAPAGPWSVPVLLYKCPEMAKDKGVFSYAAKAHPWAVTGDELLISYCVNTWEFARLFREDEVYRPKFVRVHLEPN